MSARIICNCWSNPQFFLCYAQYICVLQIHWLPWTSRHYSWVAADHGKCFLFTVYHLRQTIFEQKQSKNALRNLCRTCVHFWCYLFNAISLDQTCHNCTNFRHVKPQPLLKGGGPDWSMDIPGRTVQNQTAPVRTSRRGNRRLGFQPGVLGFHPHLTMQMWQPPFIYVRCQVLVSPQIRDV